MYKMVKEDIEREVNENRNSKRGKYVRNLDQTRVRIKKWECVPIKRK